MILRKAVLGLMAKKYEEGNASGSDDPEVKAWANAVSTDRIATRGSGDTEDDDGGMDEVFWNETKRGGERSEQSTFSEGNKKE